MLITFFSQRYFYSFIFLFSLFYIQPSIKEIEETLKWISILTIFIWIVSIFDNSIIYVPKESLKIFLHLKKAQGNLDFGMAIGGYELVFFYYCFRVNSLIKKYSFSVLCQVLLLVTFFLLYQNRSMLIGVFLIFSYMIVKMRSYYKPVILVVLGCMIVVVFFYTLDLLQGMISESQHQLNDSNYNRWKAFYYYLGDYHPNIWGYFFGSGISGVGSHLMSVTISNRLRGIYASDVGMIGMWANYGIIPILVLYSMVLKILFKRKYPLFLKFLSFHILVVPTIYQFWMNPGILLFCLFIYLYAYSTELNKSYL